MHHDDLDTAVFAAYGWPADLTDEQLFERLVALNAARAAEERAGLVRWLRPEFQNPSGTTAATQPALPSAAAPAASAKATPLPKWPSKMPEQIVAVQRALARDDRSWSAEEIATSFKSARRAAVTEVLESLAGLGHLVTFEANGEQRWKAPSRSVA